MGCKKMGWVSVAHCNRSLEGWGGCVRVVWSCTWLTFCVLVFLLFGCLFRDDLRMASAKTRTPPKIQSRDQSRDQSSPSPETSKFSSKFSSKFPPQNFTHIIPETIPQKKNIKVRVIARLTHFEYIYTLLPPHSHCLVPNGDETTTVQDPMGSFSSVLRDFCR